MKRRVLHLLASNSYSGAENVVCTIINNCSDKYDMYYCSPDGSIRDSLKSRNIKFIPLKKLSILELRRIVKEYNIDIIHAHDYKASFIVALSGFKGRIISHLHCDYNLLSCCFFVGRIYAIIQKRFDRVIVISKEILDNAYFSNKILDKVEVINNVVDKKLIMDKSRMFKSTYYDLIFVGRLTEVKRPEIVIEITRRLKERYLKIKTCIIGTGELENKCRELIDRYKLEKNIDMLGFCDNPFPYMKNSKVLVMPSSYEGLGLVAIEAMILKTIVVNSGVGGLKSIFNNYSQYICDDIDDYVSCISKLLTNDKNTYEDDCDKMIKNFTDMEKYKKKIIEVYEDVVK